MNFLVSLLAPRVAPLKPYAGLITAVLSAALTLNGYFAVVPAPAVNEALAVLGMLGLYVARSPLSGAAPSPPETGP